MSLVQLDGVTAGYGRRAIVHQLNLSVAAGEIVALLGPNGAGKSTVLKAIFGLVTVSSGRVLYAGRDITGRPPADNLRDRIAYLPQGGQVFGPLSVDQNLRVAAPPAADSADPLADWPELAARRRQRAGSLSGGQKQQLAIAMALRHAPRLLLVDEPSIGLAPRLARETLERLRRVREQSGAGILLVEQNVALALAIAERAVLLVNGRLVADRRVPDIVSDHAVRRQFTFGLDSPDISQPVSLTSR